MQALNYSMKNNINELHFEQRNYRFIEPRETHVPHIKDLTQFSFYYRKKKTFCDTRLMISDYV